MDTDAEPRPGGYGGEWGDEAGMPASPGDNITTIRVVSALSSERCHHYHQADVRHISPRLSAFLMAFLFALPIIWLGILQIKLPNTTSSFTNFLYSTLSFPFVDSLSSTNWSVFSDNTFYSF